jgi:hypothetical protein
MDDAFDTIRKQRVRAANASEGRFPDRYLCPVCQAEVFYASGQFQSPHFRHRPGNEHEDCERYAKNFHLDVPLSQHEYEHLDAVLVAAQSSAKKGTFISFAVRFRPAYHAGFVNFIAGESSTPYTIHPNLRQQYFQISVPEKNYLIKAQLSGRNHELHIVEGFDETPAVFRANDREAVRIPKHRVLKPGGYIVVSRKPIHNFHESVEAQSSKTIAGLHATLIQIPEDPNWQVRQNLKSLIQFDIAASIADYGFLTPASAYELAPDCWEMSKDSELAILIRVSRHLVPNRSQLLVQERRSGQLSTDYVTLKNDAGEFVIQSKPGPRRPDLIRIGFAQPIQFLFEIRFAIDVVLPQCANILFKFVSGSKTRTRLTWSSHELPTALMDASRGNGTLVSVTLPKSLQISLSDRRGQRITIPEESPEEKILSFLKQARFPCVLAASGFPDVVLRRRRSLGQRPIASLLTAAFTARSRRHARLLSAFNRGRVSAYSLRSIAQ